MSREVKLFDLADLPENVRRRIAEAQANPEPVEIGPPHDETVEQARERVQAQAARKSARWYARLPEDYADASLADFDQEVAARAGGWLANPRSLNFIAAGPVGTGKTRLAFAIGRLAVAEGQWVEAWSAHELLHEMMPSADNPGLMEVRAKSCTLLLLDDFNATKASPWAVEMLTAIMDHRVANHRKTIITTNTSQPDLVAVWGERLVDRISGYGAVAQRFTGRSRRVQW